MSRIANNPVTIPAGVEVQLNNQQLDVKSSKGQLSHQVPDCIDVTIDGSLIRFAAHEGVANAKALSGTTRALVNNMVVGVSQAFEKKLTLIGVGYRAQVQGKILNLTLGFSHPVNFNIPEGIQIETPSQTEIIVKGISKQVVGQVAANIRAYRPPEPYKGKGVRYADEYVARKEAKKK
ncbi:50S ribosomal protein L6 [Candidatus Venteria ishoeyi]|uniref:Large ribosomal subunit protein uL6 n=1 Tax=Candidatus Venteria ishoeyi TaxID=1899563 RepID=A0A1H6FAD5_9GAMM|nr:50S ribosomal protein L6 [Candidatus Venteria ishoeyi]MDM8545915.1 50S ribosomal protein L6 [Candidatus Venteria ishoeyi]SEH05965.1 50S ribosomal protein L6 [Candidatus Venteria ishoeyi]